MDYRTRDAILALPHRHHPQLRPAVEHLAARPGMTFEVAVDLLEEARIELRISSMDIEMSVPGAAPSVAFAPVKVGAATSEYQDSVNAHLHRMLQQQKEQR